MLPRKIGQTLVALFMRAWIEIISKTNVSFVTLVALFMRAWIEITNFAPL